MLQAVLHQMQVIVHVQIAEFSPHEQAVSATHEVAAEFDNSEIRGGHLGQGKSQWIGFFSLVLASGSEAGDQDENEGKSEREFLKLPLVIRKKRD
jgi:hypothetical protein